jgi:hypothetical protein
MAATTNDSQRIVRVLVALDDSPRSVAALTTAGALAAELDAELAGLFVEDDNLRRLLGLPFAREFNPLSGEVRPLSPAELERTWRREAEAIERRLAEAAGRLRLRWSFRIARGSLSAEVGTVAQAQDLLVLGRRTSVSLLSVAETSYRLSGIVPRARVGPVLVLFEEPAAAANSLEVGARIARLNDAELVVLIDAASDEAYRITCARAQAVAQGLGASGRCARLPALDGANLIRAARQHGAGCLVLPDRQRFLTQAALARVLDELDCPVVLTR